MRYSSYMIPEIIVVAHNIRSSHNIGSLFRTCEGIGVKKIIISGYSPYPAHADDVRLPHIYKKVDSQIEKTALGAQKSQSWQRIEDISAVIKELAGGGFTICALEQAPKSIRLNEFEVPKKVALIIGNEVAGLEEEMLTAAEYILEIPMFGKKESFNVIQAAAMALYAFRFDAK